MADGKVTEIQSWEKGKKEWEAGSMKKKDATPPGAFQEYGASSRKTATTWVGVGLQGKPSPWGTVM